MQYGKAMSKALIEKNNMGKNGKNKFIRYDSIHITKTNKMLGEYLEKVMRGEAQLSKSLKRKSAKIRKRKR